MKKVRGTVDGDQTRIRIFDVTKKIHAIIDRHMNPAPVSVEPEVGGLYTLTEAAEKKAARGLKGVQKINNEFVCRSCLVFIVLSRHEDARGAYFDLIAAESFTGLRGQTDLIIDHGSGPFPSLIAHVLESDVIEAHHFANILEPVHGDTGAPEILSPDAVAQLQSIHSALQKDEFPAGGPLPAEILPEYKFTKAQLQAGIAVVSAHCDAVDEKRIIDPEGLCQEIAALGN